MRLSDTQLILLSEASNRDDRAVIIPDRLKGGATAKVIGPLLKANLIEEIPAAGSLPVWRRDEDGAPHALVITQAGLQAIHAGEVPKPTPAGKVRPSQRAKIDPKAKSSRTPAPKASQARPVSPAKPTKSKPRSSIGPAAAKKASKTAPGDRPRKGAGSPADAPKDARAPAQAPPRDGSKLASLVVLLGRRQGASIDEITTATGWLPHTARAALTGLRKRGFDVVRSKEARGKESRTIYRIGG